MASFFDYQFNIVGNIVNVLEDIKQNVRMMNDALTESSKKDRWTQQSFYRNTQLCWSSSRHYRSNRRHYTSGRQRRAATHQHEDVVWWQCRGCPGNVRPHQFAVVGGVTAGVLEAGDAHYFPRLTIGRIAEDVHDAVDEDEAFHHLVVDAVSVGTVGVCDEVDAYAHVGGVHAPLHLSPLNVLELDKDGGQFKCQFLLQSVQLIAPHADDSDGIAYEVAH